MRIIVRYFAVLRERAGTDVAELDLPVGATAADAYLGTGLLPGLPVGFAVNEQIVGGGTVLHEGDEVAFLPPLGGG